MATTASVTIVGEVGYLNATSDPTLLLIPLTNFFREVVSLGTSYSQDEAPALTGRLRASIKGRVTRMRAFGPSEAQITQDGRTYWGKYVLEGVGPHTIVPSKKKALFWATPPGPRKSVNHPGQRANPFFDRAAARLLTAIEGPLSVAFQADLAAEWAKRTGP